jgi:DNA-binding LytR/AlgR family response regulator
MLKVKILIIEDDAIIAESSRVMLEEMGFEVTGVFAGGAEVIEAFRPDLADLAIVDIHLANHTSGIDVATVIQRIKPIPFIFITSSKDEYLRKKAIFETNAVYYLEKPFSRTDLSIAVDLAIKNLKLYQFEALEYKDMAYLSSNAIFMKSGMGYKKISISDILYLEADGSYCKFILKDARAQIFSETLSYFGEKLSFAKELMRVQRSYIVNVNYVERVHENRLWIKGEEIAIGRTYRKAVLSHFRFI